MRASACARVHWPMGTIGMRALPLLAICSAIRAVPNLSSLISGVEWHVPSGKITMDTPSVSLQDNDGHALHEPAMLNPKMALSSVVMVAASPFSRVARARGPQTRAK